MEEKEKEGKMQEQVSDAPTKRADFSLELLKKADRLNVSVVGFKKVGD